MEDHLIKIYQRLLGHFGAQHWWPAETPFEVCIGAILTQNTAWRNVEKAIKNLKNNGLLSPKAIQDTPVEELANVITPAGYFNIKARRLKAFIDFFEEEFQGSLDVMFSLSLDKLRPKLLKVWGIGPETADSILLYAGSYPIFVIDAYTKRILSRHGLGPRNTDYQEWQQFFMEILLPNPELYNEYHALLVQVGKNYCRREPRCADCPLFRL